MRPSWLWGLGALAFAPTSATLVHALVTYEVYTDRAAFDARLGGSNAVRVVDFDDIDTSTANLVPFSRNRYRASKGVRIDGESGQFVSRSFGFPADFPPVSAPNLYAPGPVSDVFGEGGNTTFVSFRVGVVASGKVAGVGVVFVDADYPGTGPSRLAVYDQNFTETFTTGTVSGGDASRLFRGIVAVDGDTTQPTPAIYGALIVSGNGWLGFDDNEGVALDDLVFGVPTSGGKTGEICDNCLDDDDDGLIDREDDECDQPADGGERGLGDVGAAKAMIKCQKSTAKAGVAFVQATAKQLHACVDGVAQCLEVKPGDAACLTKAQSKCAAAKAKIDALYDKLLTSGGKACQTVPDAVTFGATGFGWGGEAVDCDRYGVTLVEGRDTGICFVRQQFCRAQQLVSRENARALELATLGGLDPADFRCLENGADGNGVGLGDAARGKAAMKCQKALTKAGAAFASKRQKGLAKCFDAVTACIQLKPDDAACMSKAQATCEKVAHAVFWDPFGTSLFGKAEAAIAKACDPIPLADLLAPEGLGQGAFAAQCVAIGDQASDSVSAVADCLLDFHACRTDRLVEKQYPRAIELEELGFD